MKLTKYDIACSDYKTALLLKPANDEVLKAIASSYYHLGIYDSAIVYLGAEIQQTSDNHNEYLLLANIYKKKDNSVKALEWIEKAITLNENEPAQYFFAGDIYYKDNNKEAALKYLQLFQNKYTSLDFSKLSEKKKDEYFKMNSRSIDLINMIQRSK